MLRGNGWGRVAPERKGLAPDGAGLKITVVQKHTKHTLRCVFVCEDSRVRHCVSNLVKEHSSRLTRLIFRDVAFNDDNVVYPELAA